MKERTRIKEEIVNTAAVLLYPPSIISSIPSSSSWYNSNPTKGWFVCYCYSIEYRPQSHSPPSSIVFVPRGRKMTLRCLVASFAIPPATQLSDQTDGAAAINRGFDTSTPSGSHPLDLPKQCSRFIYSLCRFAFHSPTLENAREL